MIIIIALQVIQIILAVLLLHKGSFVTVKNEVLYVPQKKTVKKIVREEVED